jgi:hypothetical protein
VSGDPTGALISFLQPLLPFLASASAQILDEMGKLVGGEVGGAARDIWRSLLPRLEDRPRARQALEEARGRTDVDRDTIVSELMAVLAEEPELARTLTALIPRQAVTVTDSSVGNLILGDVKTRGPIVGRDYTVRRPEAEEFTDSNS